MATTVVPAAEPAPAESSHKIAIGDQLAVGYLFAAPAERPVAPGDRLSLTCHVELPEPGQPYLIRPGDEVSLWFPSSPEIDRMLVVSSEKSVRGDDSYRSLSGRYVVQPEGTLALRALPTPLAVLDRTTSEVSRMVSEAYLAAGLLERADVNVSVEPRLMREQTLRQAIIGGENGPGRLTLTVSPAGRITAPLVAGLQVAGLGIDEVAAELTRRYQALGYPRLSVTATVEAAADPLHEGLRELLAGHHPLRVRVLGSGELSLPLAPGHPAAGKPASQLGRELTAHYRELGLDRVTVTVWVEEAARAR